VAREHARVYNPPFEHARVRRAAQQPTAHAATWTRGPIPQQQQQQVNGRRLWLVRGLDEVRASRNGATEQIERGREEEPNVDRRLFTGVPQASTALPFRLML